ncbi:MAG: DUF2393 domain-containing protein [Acidobacteriota bacterium]|nr:DUF2393 domain-containing protein [Acidobacteriota bacterium]
MIKVLNSILLSFVFTPLASAQSPANDQKPLDVVVLKFSWNRERIGWEKDPFSGPLENFDEMRARSRNERRILDAKKGGSSIEVDKLKREARADEAIIAKQHQNTRARYGFVYKVSLKNSGSKPIKSIDWDYVFFDTPTRNERGRRQFTSEEKIAPGKTREMRFFIPSPPTQAISVSSLNKNERQGLGESVLIVRIEYSDGSIWERP